MPVARSTASGNFAGCAVAATMTGIAGSAGAKARAAGKT